MQYFISLILPASLWSTMVCAVFANLSARNTLHPDFATRAST